MRHILIIVLGFLLHHSPLLASDNYESSPLSIGEGADAKFTSDPYSYSRRYSKYDAEAHHYYNRALRERVRILEQAVRDLQYEMSQLKSDRYELGYDKKRLVFSCLLTTPFHGTYYGKGDTLIEAKAKSLQACEKNKSAMCREERVSCERSPA